MQTTAVEAAGNEASSISFPTVIAGDVQTTKSFLEADGALLETFRVAVQPLANNKTDVSGPALLTLCTSVAHSLDSVNPTDLLTLAQGVPDPVLADLFVAERRVVSDALVACGKGDTHTTDVAVVALRNTETMIDRRLRELGL